VLEEFRPPSLFLVEDLGRHYRSICDAAL